MEPSLESNIIEFKTYLVTLYSMPNVTIMKQDIIQDKYQMEMEEQRQNITRQLKRSSLGEIRKQFTQLTQRMIQEMCKM